MTFETFKIEAHERLDKKYANELVEIFVGLTKWGQAIDEAVYVEYTPLKDLIKKYKRLEKTKKQIHDDLLPLDLEMVENERNHVLKDIRDNAFQDLFLYTGGRRSKFKMHELMQLAVMKWAFIEVFPEENHEGSEFSTLMKLGEALIDKPMTRNTNTLINEPMKLMREYFRSQEFFNFLKDYVEQHKSLH